MEMILKILVEIFKNKGILSTQNKSKHGQTN